LLIGSIPLPDPNRRWSGEAPASAIGEQAGDGMGCKFADRCPQAFSLCLGKAPPLFQTNQHRAAACYLYQDHSSIRHDEMDKVFVQRTAPSKTEAGSFP